MNKKHVVDAILSSASSPEKKRKKGGATSILAAPTDAPGHIPGKRKAMRALPVTRSGGWREEGEKGGVTSVLGRDGKKKGVGRRAVPRANLRGEKTAASRRSSQRSDDVHLRAHTDAEEERKKVAYHVGGTSLSSSSPKKKKKRKLTLAGHIRALQEKEKEVAR